MSDYPHLFSPITVRGLTLKNRIVMPGMGTLFMSDRFVSDQLIDYHVARAKGGTGLNIIEVSSVHMPSAPPRYGCLADDKFIPGYKKLTDAIHAAGGKAGVFLWQGGLVAGSFPGTQMIVPSDMPISDETIVPGATKEQLEELVECYGQAARRAVEAGMDCLELHAAHTYIIHSFLSGGINHRTDEYGGSPENRARFPLAVIRSIRKHMPDDMPLFMRVNAHDDYLENGLTIEETIAFCKWAGEAGVDVIDVSRGNTLTNGLKYEVPSLDIPYAFNVDNAARIRKETGMPVMAVGRINGAQLAEKILEEDKADLIGMGRVQLTDPEFCNKAREGRVMEIMRCIGCNQGCFDAHMKPEMPHITCLRNPSVGKEQEYALKPAEQPKTVVVAGGGPGGMEAADVLAARGHRVILCEASGRLGGQFMTAGLSPRKGEIKAAMMHRGTQIKHSPVEVRLDTPASPEVLASIQPDVVINAIGARAMIPPIPGVDLPFVFGSHSVLEGKEKPEGKNVAVIGGGMVGLEVSEFLADRGHAVTAIEMGPEAAKDLGAVRKICVMENVAEKGIQVIVNAKCTGISEQGVSIEKDGKEEIVPADCVIIAVGSRSNSFEEARDYCEKNGIPVYNMGDAVKPARALDSIALGAKIGREL